MGLPQLREHPLPDTVLIQTLSLGKQEVGAGEEERGAQRISTLEMSAPPGGRERGPLLGQPRLPHPDPGLNLQGLKPGAASPCQALRPEGERAEREMGAR